MKDLPKDLRDKVQFALFCITFEVSPRDAADLVHLARRAFHAGERGCNTADDKGAEQRAGAAFEAKARELDFDVIWPGLWPQLSRAGYDITLPS